MGMQVVRWLRSWAERAPERVAVTTHAETVTHTTYRELDAMASRIGAALCARDLRPGDRVALLGDNGLEFASTFYGALYAGLVVVPIPTSSPELEIRFRLAHSGARTIVTDAAHATLGARACEGNETTLALVESLASSDSGFADPLDLPADSNAMLLYTSGTTGTPKAACITHASLVAHTSAIVHHVIRLDADDVVLGTIPLTHSYGLRIALLAPLFAGARVVLLPRFDLARVRAALYAEGVSFFPGVPTMFSALARDGVATSAPRLRWCLSAGAPLGAAVRERAEAALGAAIHEGYGLTEATFTSIDEPGEAADAGSVGRPVPGVEIRIVDDAGRALGRDAVGEVVVRGQNVMAGYFEDAEATRAAFLDGWLATGDLGTIDARGRLRIVDRKKDLIVRGGFNVVPAAIEAALAAHPGIDGALVVGVPDSHFGEEIAAIITLRGRLDAASLLAHLETRLARTQHPRLYAIVSALPIGASGKALRREVRDRIASHEIVLERLFTG